MEQLFSKPGGRIKVLVLQGYFENNSGSEIESHRFNCYTVLNKDADFEYESYDMELMFYPGKNWVIDGYTDLDCFAYLPVPGKVADAFVSADVTIAFNDDFDWVSTVMEMDGLQHLAESDYTYILSSNGSSGSSVAAAPADTASQPETSSTTPIQLGDKITTDEYEFTLNNVELAYELKSTNTSSVYTSYEAESGKIYVHVDGSYYNTSKKDLHVRDLCQPDVDFDNGYTYSGFAVVDKDDNSFTWASSYVICTPLETCHYHGLVECPNVIESSDAPLFVTLKLADGVTYRYDIR